MAQGLGVSMMGSLSHAVLSTTVFDCNDNNNNNLKNTNNNNDECIYVKRKINSPQMRYIVALAYRKCSLSAQMSEPNVKTVLKLLVDCSTSMRPKLRSIRRR